MKIKVYVTSGDYIKWRDYMADAAAELGFNFQMDVIDPYPDILDPFGILDIAGLKDFYKMCEYLDEDVIIRPRRCIEDGDKYDMVIEIYDEWREN